MWLIYSESRPGSSRRGHRHHLFSSWCSLQLLICLLLSGWVVSRKEDFVSKTSSRLPYLHRTEHENSYEKVLSSLVREHFVSCVERAGKNRYHARLYRVRHILLSWVDFPFDVGCVHVCWGPQVAFANAWKLPHDWKVGHSNSFNTNPDMRSAFDRLKGSQVEPGYSVPSKTQFWRDSQRQFQLVSVKNKIWCISVSAPWLDTRALWNQNGQSQSCSGWILTSNVLMTN